MLKRQDIKPKTSRISLNSSGNISCLMLFLLTFSLFNPSAPSAHAFDSAPDDGTSSTTTLSTVNISFSPTSGSASLTPTSTSGASALISIKATVGVENSGGYTVYLGSTSSALTGKTTSQTIPALSSSTVYSNLPINTWGYNATETTTAPTNPTLSAMPANTRGVTIGSNSSTNIKSDSKTFQLSFAANIGPDKPADTYENQVTLSVISSPLEITETWDTISTMQEMTTEICAKAASSASKQLRDTRDGKYYWVSKLADGKCWMTQNLDFDLSTSTTLTPSTSDVSSNWAPGYSTASSATSSTILASDTGTRSWNLGNYRIKNPASSSNCSYPKNSAADCSSQFTAYTTPTSANGDVNAHYILGNHYQWNAATAGTGGTITSGQASSSVCPKGWKLPTSNTSTTGSFGGLINASNIGSNVTTLTSAPYYFVRGGLIDQNASILYADAGASGYYWSSTPSSNGVNAYNLYFSSTASINTSDSAGTRRYGRSVRCIAR